MRKLRAASIALLVLVLSVTTACGGGAPPLSAAPAAAPVAPTAAPAPIVVTDDRGKTFTSPTAPKRVVSLAPSATEIVFALGAGASLVAVDDFSDYPAEAKALPKLGGYRASPERIVVHQPDVILAITSGNLAEQLDAMGQKVVVMDPVGLAGVYRNIVMIGTLLDRKSAADELVAKMRSQIGSVAERAAKASTRPRVMHQIDSTNPTKVYVAGKDSYIDEIMRLVGATNIAGSSATKYPILSGEEIVRSDPEIIILSDARFGATPEGVGARPGHAGISAVRTKRILPIDDDLVSRPGPRLVLGVEAYAKLVHPEIFGAAP